MNISRSDLYRIVLEEYVREEGIDEAKVDDLIAHIKGGPKPDWMGDDPRETPPPPEVPGTEADPEGSDIFPMEKPPRPEMSHDELAATIGELIHGKDPEEVSEIFQLAFEKLPGVELSSPGDPDYPGEETLYTPGAEGRPAAGFRLEELMSLITETLREGHYHDMGDEDETYDVRDAGVERHTLVQRIEQAYHDLQDAFEEFEDQQSMAIGQQFINGLETLMDTIEHPEDYRE